MRAAINAEALNQYTPDLIEPLRDAAAAQFGRARGEGFEVVGAEGTQAALALALLATVDDGDEVIVSDPGYFHIPSAVLAAGGVPVPVRIDAASAFRLDPDAVRAAITTRTRAICIVDPVNPYGVVQTRGELEALAGLAERHGLLLLHDVTHAPLALEPTTSFASLPALELTDNAVAAMSVSHCWGMAGARLGFLGGPPGFVRGCLQLKAALTRLNTNLVSQHGALAALEDREYLPAAQRTIGSNLARLEAILARTPALKLVVRPQRGLACAIDVSETGASAQELMVALFARRVAVYPGDGLGENGAFSTLRLNLSRPDPWAMDHFDAVLPEAVEEAASGRWRSQVLTLLEEKGTARAGRLADAIRALT
jgi:arginine:pyruvate transaminase